MLRHLGKWSCEFFRVVHLIRMRLSEGMKSLVLWMAVNINFHIGEACDLWLVTYLVLLIFVECFPVDHLFFHSLEMLRISMSMGCSEIIVFILSFLPLVFGRIFYDLIISCKDFIFHRISIPQCTIRTLTVLSLRHFFRCLNQLLC